ncbi:hypothetical protein [Nonomuraea sp. CA-141351]|uniref:hypothetical protein n=1 Tax=Nonomuraea sp. CA-141351 TaxID=3239996 RepID=UPI003D91A448
MTAEPNVRVVGSGPAVLLPHNAPGPGSVRPIAGHLPVRERPETTYAALDPFLTPTLESR